MLSGNRYTDRQKTMCKVFSLFCKGLHLHTSLKYLSVYMGQKSVFVQQIDRYTYKMNIFLSVFTDIFICYTDRPLSMCKFLGPLQIDRFFCTCGTQTHTQNAQTQKQQEPLPPYPPLALSCTPMASFAIAPNHSAVTPHESF